MGTEEVQIITLLGLMVALLFNARSYTLQANATDVSNFLEIHNLITEKWPYSGPRPTSPVALRRSSVCRFPAVCRSIPTQIHPLDPFAIRGIKPICGDLPPRPSAR